MSPARCTRPGCLGYGHGGLCPACARLQLDAELRREGWTDEQIRAARESAASIDGLEEAIGEEPLPPQGEA